MTVVLRNPKIIEYEKKYNEVIGTSKKVLVQGKKKMMKLFEDTTHEEKGQQ